LLWIPFSLEDRVERLGEGVVIAVALGSDRGHGTGHGEPLGVAHDLRAAVGVVEQGADVLPVPAPMINGALCELWRVDRAYSTSNGDNVFLAARCPQLRR
jgi:hypothetical protein